MVALSSMRDEVQLLILLKWLLTFLAASLCATFLLTAKLVDVLCCLTHLLQPCGRPSHNLVQSDDH